MCFKLLISSMYSLMHSQTAMKIIGKLCNRQHTVICPKCSVTIDNIAVHTLQYCRENENVRLKLGKV